MAIPARPPQAAIDWLLSKEPTPAFSYHDVWAAEHGYAFTVAKMMQADLLADVQQALADHLAQGLPFEQFKRELTPLLQRKGWWGKQEMTDPLDGVTKPVQLGSDRRLKTIFETNMATARAHAQWQRIEENKSTHPYLQYQLGPSEKHRPAHVQQAGKIYAVDDPFWRFWMPRNGYGCKCHVIAMTRRRAEREGGVSEPTPIVWTEVVNPRTGEIRPTVVGITPGFETNPGTQRQAHLQQLVTEKLERVGAPVGNAIIKQLLVERPFQQFLAQPQGFFPVAVMTPAAQAKLGTQAATVRLSAESMKKQIKHHPELLGEEYSLISELVDSGLPLPSRQPEKVVYIEQVQSRWYHVVLKATKDKRELYLVSMHRLKEADAMRKREQYLKAGK